MKKFLLVIVLVFVGVAGYRIGDLVSHDVIVMSIGVLFGVIAGIPYSLLLLAAQRRQQDAGYQQRRDDYHQPTLPQPYQHQQPPMMVYPGQQPTLPYHQPQVQQPQWPTGGGAYTMLPGPQDGRFGKDDDSRKWGGR